VIVLVGAASLLFVGCSKGGASGKGGPIPLMQNKPEIDAQLKAYAADWSKTSGIPLTSQTLETT